MSDAAYRCLVADERSPAVIDEAVTNRLTDILGFTDQQWALVEPLLPAPRTGGRLEEQPTRSMVDGILYVVWTGCAWRQLPADVAPWQTVYW